MPELTARDRLDTQLEICAIHRKRMEWAGKPFLDQLARLEQLEIIPSVDQWLVLRKARNASAHEYTYHPTEGAILLNDLALFAQILLGILLGIESFLALRSIRR